MQVPWGCDVEILENTEGLTVVSFQNSISRKSRDNTESTDEMSLEWQEPNGKFS